MRPSGSRRRRGSARGGAHRARARRRAARQARRRRRGARGGLLHRRRRRRHARGLRRPRANAGTAMRLLAAAVLSIALLAAPAVALGLEAVRGVVHVHTDLSTGELSLEELAALADKQGIGALLLAENYLLRVEYGLAPFRALTRVTFEERSVHGGLEHYLERVARLRAQFPRVLILPGVEVVPHYFWTGSAVAQELHLHDTQKNLLVFGVDDATALRRLPVAGNRARGYGLQSLLDALPMLLVIPGVLLIVRKRRSEERRVGKECRSRWSPYH